MIESEHGCDFKKGWVGIPIPDAFPDRVEPVGDLFFSNHLAVHPDPLAVADQVRGGEQSGAITLRAADGIDHGADGALAVRPGHMNDALTFPGQLQLTQEALDVFEPKFDSETLGAVKPGERFPVTGLHALVEK
jgi:hypothetical protein